jgi:O-antigen/teichoic acid export membrane protein
MTMVPRPAGWRSTAALGALVGVGGFAIAGTLGGLVGLLAGCIAARRERLVLIAAGLALLVTAALTLLERPLSDSLPSLTGFPNNHPDANVAGAIAGVLLLAGVAGLLAPHRDRPPGPPPPEGPPGDGTRRPPASTLVSVLVAALLGALTLWWLGDRSWEAEAIAASAIAVLLLAAAVVLALRHRTGPLPGPVRTAASVLDDLRREHARMLTGSVWLLAGTLVVSLGSFVFWLLAARNVPADDVGRATALFSATWFVYYVTSLGLPIAVSRHAPDRTRASTTLFAWSLLLALAASLLGVSVFAAVAPDSVREPLATWPAGLAWPVVFLIVAGLAVSLLVDVRLMALGRWSLVFWRSVLVAAVRLPFLFWVPDQGAALYLYVVFAGGFAVTGVAFLVPLVHRNWLRLRPLPMRAIRAARFAAVNYIGQLAVQAPFFTVPIVVLVHVDAVEFASFYLSWGVMAVVYVGVHVIAQAFLVEGGRGGADHRRQAMAAMGVGAAMTGSATLLSVGLGPLLARVYGPDYGPVATLLPLLMSGTIPFAVTMTMLTTARIREHSSSTIAVAGAVAVAVLVPTSILASGHGALGAAWGWTIGNLAAAALAVLASRLPYGGTEEEGQAEAAATSPIVPIAALERTDRES